MRTGDKSELAEAIWKMVSPKLPTQTTTSTVWKDANVQHVIDGGSLIHRIPWTKKHQTWGKLFDITHQYIIRVYGEKTTVWFDGYPNKPTTKDEAHLRRAGEKASTNITISQDRLIPVSKKAFLANKKNNQAYIDSLSQFLIEKGVNCKLAQGDADMPMIQEAMSSAETHETYVHGEDTDLLVLLLSLTTRDHEKITLIPHQKKASKKKRKVWRIQETQVVLGEDMSRRLLFTHAFSGCDTTARPFGIGKTTVFNKIQNDYTLGQSADVFLNAESSKEEIVQAGDVAMRIIHGGSLTITLGDFRYAEYKRRVLKGTKAVHAESLPPTSGSTKHQSLRTFHQIMTWKNIYLDPEKYGYKLIMGKLRGVITEMEPAPPELLKTIFCNCTTGCERKTCTCKKLTLCCTDLCGKCKGVSCSNTTIYN